MVKQVIKYKDKNYSIFNNAELKQLIEDLDLTTVEELLNMESDFIRIGFNNIVGILEYAMSKHKVINGMSLATIYTCDHCGKETDGTKKLRGSYGSAVHICDHCIEENDYKLCKGCGYYEKGNTFKVLSVYNIFNQEHLAYITVCGRCVSNGNCNTYGDLYKCRHCNSHYTFAKKRDNGEISYGVWASYTNYYNICPICNEQHTVCRDCGNVVSRTDIDENGFCTSCVEKAKKRIKLKGYGYKPEPDFKKTDKEPKTTSDYMGVELEVELKYNSSKDKYDIAYEGTETTEDFVYAKTDGSLCNGVEFVTHPITFKAWRETYLERLENELLSKLRADLDDNATTAGLHIHLNKKSLGRNEEIRKQVIARICYLLSIKENYEYLTKFCKRDANRIKQWAKPYLIYNINNAYSDTTPLEQQMRLDKNDRYHVVNLRNKNTIEFRCFSSTTDIRDIQAYMVFIYNVVEYCKKNDDNTIKNTKLQDIMTIYYKKFMTEYLKERGLI